MWDIVLWSYVEIQRTLHLNQNLNKKKDEPKYNVHMQTIETNWYEFHANELMSVRCFLYTLYRFRETNPYHCYKHDATVAAGDNNYYKIIILHNVYISNAALLQRYAYAICIMHTYIKTTKVRAKNGKVTL